MGRMKLLVKIKKQAMKQGHHLLGWNADTHVSTNGSYGLRSYA